MVFMHSWPAVGSMTECGIIVADGFAALEPDMRGRSGANGANDASGREIYDIYDALVAFRARYADYVDPDIAIIAGHSGGGANVLAACCKFPDTFAAAVDIYGIADYGRDPTNGWYQNTGAYTSVIAAAVGDTPTNTPDAYYARDAVAAIHNYTGGKLVLLHDTGDTDVPYVNSTRIKAAMDAVGLTNYATSFTTVGDSPRWTHASVYPIGANWAAAKAVFLPLIAGAAAWTIPASGTVTVIGYIKTKRFSIWLNYGLDAAATVVYDTVAGTYTVTPLTSNAVVAVTITQGAKSASGNTNGATLFTVS
jgi:pimeloyl-ACP methyl ester carboxylesterase